MFKFKDIIQMDYETYRQLLMKINASQTAFVLAINREQHVLEMKIGDTVAAQYPFEVEPWMEPEE